MNLAKRRENYTGTYLGQAFQQLHFGKPYRLVSSEAQVVLQGGEKMPDILLSLNQIFMYIGLRGETIFLNRSFNLLISMLDSQEHHLFSGETILS